MYSVNSMDRFFVIVNTWLIYSAATGGIHFVTAKLYNIYIPVKQRQEK